jgi:gas vesicle protein
MAHRDDLPYIVIERRGLGVGAFLYGAAIGAGLALLFAPRSGRETRAELRTGVMRMKDRAEEAVRNIQDTVTGTIDEVREEVSERIEAARDAFDAGREAARETRAQMERRIREARAGVEAGVAAARAQAESESGEEDTGFGV